MPLFPSYETLQNTFGGPYLRGRPQTKTNASGPTPYQARLELYPAYSVVDDAKNKAQKLSAEAAKEFDKATKKGQQENGKIELYSGKYYAACTFGGLLACVSGLRERREKQHADTGWMLTVRKGPDPRGRHPS